MKCLNELLYSLHVRFTSNIYYTSLCAQHLWYKYVIVCIIMHTGSRVYNSVGGGTDGASVNISGQNGMRGKLCKELPWVYWMWCYAHRLELTCKDACTSQLCKDLQEMLLRLYYLYAKSPKKNRELFDIVEDLKEVWELSAGAS